VRNRYLRWRRALASLGALLEDPNPLFDEAWYRATYPDVTSWPHSPWSHYRLHGAREGRQPNPFFDASWYLANYPEVRQSGVDPLRHYLHTGWLEGLDPGPEFSTTAYLDAHPRLKSHSINPLLHLLESGSGSNLDYVPAGIDRAYSIPGLGAFIIGWLNPSDRIASIRVRTAKGQSPNLLQRMVHVPRHDTGDAQAGWGLGASDGPFGFAVLGEVDTDEDGSSMPKFTLQVADTDGRMWQVKPSRDERVLLGAVGAVYDILERVPITDPKSLELNVGPAIEALWGSREIRPASVAEVVFGDPPTKPEVSIIIPIFGRYDFIEYQASLFADDEDLSRCELIYVIDDPTIRVEAESLCRSIYPTFRLATRMLLCDSNRGFAGAMNIGVAYATAPTLLLMNSDVMPAYQGWLSRLLKANAAIPSPGVLAPRLRYPDGSIQHQGMNFSRSGRYPEIWLNKHPGKGLPGAPVTGEDPVAVPAISGACMLVDAQMYRSVDGFSEDYIAGDFEDSDFCLKLREAGFRCYVAPWIDLYHLEGKSMDRSQAPVYSARTMYNAWLHSRRWHLAIERIVDDAQDA
jgi:O-antigen biosynthesis protein